MAAKKKKHQPQKNSKTDPDGYWRDEYSKIMNKSGSRLKDLRNAKCEASSQSILPSLSKLQRRIVNLEKKKPPAKHAPQSRQLRLLRDNITGILESRTKSAFQRQEETQKAQKLKQKSHNIQQPEDLPFPDLSAQSQNLAKSKKQTKLAADSHKVMKQWLHDYSIVTNLFDNFSNQCQDTDSADLSQKAAKRLRKLLTSIEDVEARWPMCVEIQSEELRTIHERVSRMLNHNAQPVTQPSISDQQLQNRGDMVHDTYQLETTAPQNGSSQPDKVNGDDRDRSPSISEASVGQPIHDTRYKPIPSALSLEKSIETHLPHVVNNTVPDSAAPQDMPTDSAGSQANARRATSKTLPLEFLNLRPLHGHITSLSSFERNRSAGFFTGVSANYAAPRGSAIQQTQYQVLSAGDEKMTEEYMQNEEKQAVLVRPPMFNQPQYGTKWAYRESREDTARLLDRQLQDGCDSSEMSDVDDTDDQTTMSGTLLYEIDLTGDASLVRKAEEDAETLRQMTEAGLDSRDCDIWYDAEDHVDVDMLP